MNLDTTLQLGDRNFAEALRRQVQWTAGAELHELDGALLACGATRFPAAPFNAVLSTCAQSPAALLDAAEELFFDKGRSFSVYARKHADAALEAECRKRDYLVSAELSIMIMMQPPCAEHAFATQPEVVADAARVSHFASVAADSFASVGLPSQVARSAFSLPERLLEPELRLVLASADGHPAACALLLLSDTIAGIYWVGTRPEAGGRGLGTACVTALAQFAFARGARAVVLQASRSLEGFYGRLGFATISRLSSFTRLGARGAASRRSGFQRGEA